MSGGELAKDIMATAARSGLQLAPTQAAAMEEHFNLLQRWNRAVSLTAVRDARSAVGLYAEPLQVLDLLPLEPGGRIVDVGSGAGFPGLLLALVRPAWRVLLVERSTRKASFLAEALRVLEIENAEVLGTDLRSAQDLPEAWGFDVLTLKAVGAFDLALELLELRGNPGSLALLFTGRGGVNEVKRVLSGPGTHRIKLIQTRRVSGRERSYIAVARKGAGQP